MTSISFVDAENPIGEDLLSYQHSVVAPRISRVPVLNRIGEIMREVALAKGSNGSLIEDVPSLLLIPLEFGLTVLSAILSLIVRGLGAEVVERRAPNCS